MTHQPLANRPRIVNFPDYCIRALIITLVLFVIEETAPTLPPWAFPVIFFAYAAPATIGSMYGVVAKRFHKQDLYNPGGKLSHYNRRWSLRLVIFFVGYSFSAFMFALQSPSWDSREWSLIWVGAIVYYFAFLLLQRFFKKEFAPKYYKAQAIKWSVLAAALIATIAYALITAHPPTDLQVDLHEIIDNRNLLFADSPSPLFAEVEKLTTYTNCLTSYGADKLIGTSYVVSFIVNLILGFSVFAGVFRLFGICLLQPCEIKSVFQLLRVDDEDSKNYIRPAYVAIPIVTWLILSGIFLYFNKTVGEIRATQEYTVVDSLINEFTTWAIIATENSADEVKEDLELIDNARDFNDRFAQKREQFVEEQMPKVLAQINAYYDRCINNIDGFAEWHESIPAKASIHIPIVGEKVIKNEFEKQVIEPSENETLDESYACFLDGLKELYQEYWSSDEFAAIVQEAQPPSADGIIDKQDIPRKLELWPSWESDEGKDLLQKVLLGKNDDEKQQAFKERVIAYIEKQRKSKITLIESLPSQFFKFDNQTRLE